MKNIKAQIEVEIKPFRTPNFALPVDDSEDARGIPLSSLPSEVLFRMCRDFEDEIFKKAKKSPPAMQAIICPRCNELV